MVANCLMNRERQLRGVNSYQRELGFDPLDFVTARLGRLEACQDVALPVGWLDLCCGTGRALTQAVDRLRGEHVDSQVVIVGIALVDAFAGSSEEPSLTLVTGSVTAWMPDRAFDLITCVHGLHYVGDKLAVLTRAAGWLAGDGLLVADLDLTSVRLDDGRPAGRRLATQLRAAGFAYDPRRRVISRAGRRAVELPYTDLGADDQAGANYTGQPAVHSYYRYDRWPTLLDAPSSVGRFPGDPEPRTALPETTSSAAPSPLDVRPAAHRESHRVGRVRWCLERG